MAGDDGRRCRSCRTAAVILVLCTLTQCLTSLSLRGLSEKEKQDEVVSEAVVMVGKKGYIFFNGKELKAQPPSAAGDVVMLQDKSHQSDGTGMLDQTSQLGLNVSGEVAWRRLNCSLHCGRSEMTVKATGLRAADLQLDTGNARPLPLNQVPEKCGYRIRQHALALELVVPYDRCNVIQEGLNYVLPMIWSETPVNFTCSMSGSSATTRPSTPKPAQQPRKHQLPLPWSQNRHKRHITQPLPTYDPNSAYYYYMYYYYYYYYYHGHYPHYHVPYPPSFPVQTPTMAPTTTVGTTTVGPMTGMTPTTTGPATKTPQKTPQPYYFHYHPIHPLTGQQMPGVPIYYYPLIQHFYGKHPHNTTPTSPPVTTVKPGDSVSTTKPPCTATAEPSVTAPPAETQKPGSYPYSGFMNQQLPYYQNPFSPYLSFNKAGKLPDDQKYKSAFQAQANAHPGFNYWQAVPWYPGSSGKDY